MPRRRNPLSLLQIAPDAAYKTGSDLNGKTIGTPALNDLNNLLTAAKATLSAHVDGEEDPLYYLRDELTAQGQLRAEQRHQERP